MPEQCRHPELLTPELLTPDAIDFLSLGVLPSNGMAQASGDSPRKRRFGDRRLAHFY